ncbi:MAG: hypothetical protein LUQ11_05265 [Methylococcaceae bacterium]|nr:hypothetical protein [Methylococcaceae bacterium]
MNSQRLARRAKTRDGFRSNAGNKRHPGGLLTRAIQALTLRAPLASKSAPGVFVFGSFLFDCMDAGGRATHGAVAEAEQKKGTRPPVRQPAFNQV